MTKSRYNWRKSKAIFEVFRTIYLNPPEIAVKDIAKQLGGKAISSISDQLRDIREEKLVIARIEGRDKYYRINHKKFNKDVEKTNLALFTSFNFEQFFSFEKPTNDEQFDAAAEQITALLKSALKYKKKE